MEVARKVPRVSDEHKTEVRNTRNAKGEGTYRVVAGEGEINEEWTGELRRAWVGPKGRAVNSPLFLR